MIKPALLRRTLLRRTLLRRTLLRRMLIALLVAVLSGAGLVQLAPASVAAAAVPITAGTPFQVSVPVQNDPQDFTFSGAAGAIPSLTRTQGSMVGSTVQLIGPDGWAVDTRQFGDFATLPQLGQDGTYTLRVYNGADTALDAKLLLRLATQKTATVTPGTPATVTIDDPGQVVRVRFPATEGRRVIVNVTSTTLTDGSGTAPSVGVDQVWPNGVRTLTKDAITGPGVRHLDIDETGTWGLDLSPRNATTGSLTLTVTSPDDQVVPVTAGTATAVHFTPTGGNVRLRVAATAGQRMVLGSTAADGISAVYDVVRPDGSVVGVSDYPLLGSRSYQEVPGDLTLSGTYTIVLRPQQDTDATESVTVWLVSDDTSTITFGTPAALSWPSPGANHVYRFTATAGQKLNLDLTQVKWKLAVPGAASYSPGVQVNLWTPEGGIFELLQPGQQSAELAAALPSTGTYELHVDPLADTVGTANLVVRSPGARTGTLALDTTTKATVGLGDVTTYSLQLAAGRRLALQVGKPVLTSNNPIGATPAVTVSVRDSTGAELATRTVTTSADFVEIGAPKKKATYTVVLDGSAGTSGTVPLTARQPQDSTTSITADKRVTATIGTPGQRARFTVAGVKGRRLTIDSAAARWTSPSGGTVYPATFTLYRPNGTAFGQYAFTSTARPAFGEVNVSGSVGNGTLDATGTWTVEVDPWADQVGSETFTVHQVTDVAGGRLTLGKARKVAITEKGQQAAFTVTWDGTTPLAWSSTGSTIPEGLVTVVGPNGRYDTGVFAAGSTNGVFNGFGDGAVAGTYSIWIDPAGTSTGSTTFTLAKA